VKLSGRWRTIIGERHRAYLSLLGEKEWGSDLCTRSINPSPTRLGLFLIIEVILQLTSPSCETK
jgi:hypothetical protein